MRDKFEKFNVKIEDRVFECDPETELKLDEVTINDDLKDQPSWYAWYASLQERAEAEYQMAKFALEITEAETDARIRITSEKKPTEAQLKAMIVLDEDCQKARLAVIEAKKIVGILRAVKEAFQHRKECAIALASNMRAQADPEIFIKKEKYDSQ